MLNIEIQISLDDASDAELEAVFAQIRQGVALGAMSGALYDSSGKDVGNWRHSDSDD